MFDDEGKTAFSIGSQMPESMIFKLINTKGAIIPTVIIIIELIQN